MFDFLSSIKFNKILIYWHPVIDYNSHKHNTTTVFHTLFQAPYPILTYTTARQTHDQHSSCSHMIGKAQRQSTRLLRRPESYTFHTLHRPSHPTQPHSYVPIPAACGGTGSSVKIHKLESPHFLPYVTTGEQLHSSLARHLR